jgi:guanine deaminase
MVPVRYCYSGLSRRRPSGTDPSIPCASPLISPFGSLILAETMQRIGIRAFVGKLSMDVSTRPTYIEPTHSESIAAARSFIDRMKALTSHLPDHARLVEPVLTPRFVLTCSDALLQGLGELAEKTGTRVQSHLAEARDLMKAVQASRGMSDLKVFERVSRFAERVVNTKLTITGGGGWLGPLVDTTNGPSALHIPFTRRTFASCSTWNSHCTLSSL